jgi:hypothetical protein
MKVKFIDYSKKTYWSISKDAIFYTNVLKKILKMLSVLKPTGVGQQWLQFNTVISLFNFQNKRYAMIYFLPKTILYQDKDTCAIRLGFGHLNKEEIEIVVKIETGL